MVLPTHTPELFEAAVKRSAELLRAGQLVALPTETVYGLAANALDAEAVARIFKAKGRPPTNPIIVHVADLEMARRCVAQWTPMAGKLAKAFWPGPLTLVLAKSAEIPEIVTAGGPTVGVRWPSHPFIQAVIRACGFPLAAPSANPSNQISPTSVQHVQDHLDIPLVVDGGPSHIGIESTVLDLDSATPRLLRPGMIHAEALLSVLGSAGLQTQGASDKVLRSPGMLKKHYSPKAKLLILSWENEQDLLAQVQKLSFAPGKTHILAHSQIPTSQAWGRVSVLPHEAGSFARVIYAELHECDARQAELIVVEATPKGPIWHGVADRLARAAASAV